jgi:hypothetical protein
MKGGREGEKKRGREEGTEGGYILINWNLEKMDIFPYTHGLPKLKTLSRSITSKKGKRNKQDQKDYC